MGERGLCKPEAGGSSPPTSTNDAKTGSDPFYCVPESNLNAALTASWARITDAAESATNAHRPIPAPTLCQYNIKVEVSESAIPNTLAIWAILAPDRLPDNMTAIPAAIATPTSRDQKPVKTSIPFP